MCTDSLTLEIVGWVILALVVAAGLYFFGQELPPMRRYFRIKRM
jgi:hypothetical protein